MVMAQSLFIALKQQNPDCQIDLLAPAWSLPLISRMPEVRSGIEMPVGHGKLDLKARNALAQKIKQKAYTQAILLPNSLKSAFIPFLANIPKRTGWRGEMRYFLLNDLRILNKQKLTKTVQRFVALAYAKNKSNQVPHITAPRLVVSATEVQKAQEKYQLTTQKPILTLCPGAEFGEAKRWRYYGELATQYIKKGWNVWLFGSAKDQAVCATIKAQNPTVIDLSGQTSLAEAIDLMSLSTAIVSNDSGLMHIGAALHLPVVAIYGSTDPHFTPPLNTQNKVLSLNLECSPCFQRICPKGHLNCLNQLNVEMVVDALENLSL